MSVTADLVSLFNGEHIVPAYNDLYNQNKILPMVWLDLIDKLNIRLSQQEKHLLAKDIRDVEHGIPCKMEIVLTSGWTPSGHRLRQLVSPEERVKLSENMMGLVFTGRRSQAKSKVKDRAEDYVTYLKVLHDYMPFIKVFRVVGAKAITLSKILSNFIKGFS